MKKRELLQIDESNIEDLRSEANYQLGGELKKFFTEEEQSAIYGKIEEAQTPAAVKKIVENLRRINVALEIGSIARPEVLRSMMENDDRNEKSASEKKIFEEVKNIREAALEYIDEAKSWLFEQGSVTAMNRAWRLVEALSAADVELVKRKIRFLERQRAADERMRELMDKAVQSRIEREEAAAEQARLEAERAEQARLEAEERARAEQERIGRQERERAEQERIAREREEQERLRREVQASLEAEREEQLRIRLAERRRLREAAMGGFENLPTEVIFVRNAQNPFKEAFEAGGVESSERQDMVWNLVEQCKSQAQIYQGRGLPEWGRDISRMEERLRNLSPEKKQIMEAEINVGKIPIFMSGKQAMLRTTLAQMEKLTPKLNEDGTVANESYLEWEDLKELIARRDEILVADIPDEPYILFTKPTQKSEFRSKTVEEQKAAIEALNINRTMENKIFAMNLHEYGAMQTIFSEMAFEESLLVYDVELEVYKPLDFSENTWTRFISLLPRFSGLVPFCSWYQYVRRLFFGSGNCVANAHAGVRLSVRVMI
jgi:hypothetical protein